MRLEVGTGSSLPIGLTTGDNILYFVLLNGQLWRTDGTSEGTLLLKSGLKRYPSNFQTLGDTLLFGAEEESSATGRELWKSDGTPEGTTLLKDIYLGEGYINLGGNGLYFKQVLEFNGNLFFVTNSHDGNAEYGYELWKTDGTPEGTSLVKDIVEGEGSSYPSYLTALGGSLYFTVWNQDNLAGLWKSDGTSAGTRQVADLSLGTVFNHPEILGILGGRLILKARDPGNPNSLEYVLWQSDGTDAGTFPYSDIENRLSSLGNARTIYPRASGGAYVFIHAFARDPELWLLREAPEVPQRVEQVQLPYSGSGGISLITWLNGNLIFAAATFNTGGELWKSDGTAAGTVLIKDINLGTGGANPYDFIIFKNELYFNAAGFDGTQDFGIELWKTDGTAEGTTMLKDLNPGPFDSYPGYYIEFNGELYFSANGDGVGIELWKTDGSSEGTVLVEDLYPGETGSVPRGFTEFSSALFFSATSPDRSGLWKISAPESTPEFLASSSQISWYAFEPAGDYLYFSANYSDGNGDLGNELWRTDGTQEGTILVKDIYAGAEDSDPRTMTALGNQIVFLAEGYDGDKETGLEIWRSNGTAEGTYILKDINPGLESSRPGDFTLLNDELYFSTDSSPEDSSTGKGIWKTDGTPENTVLLKDIHATQLTEHNGEIYYVGNAMNTGYELWKTNGTIEGTEIVKDIAEGADSSDPRNLTSFNGKLYFAVQSQGYASNSWVSDGTEEGTHNLEHLGNSPFESSPEILAVDENRLFYTIHENTGGVALRYLHSIPDDEIPVLSIDSITTEGNNLVFWCSSEPDWHYQLQRADSPNADVWINEGSMVPGNGETITLIHPNASEFNAQFYRILLRCL